MLCPYCNNDADNKVFKLEAIQIAHKNGITGEYCNPGGRELIFPWGSVHIMDNCNYCDLEKLKNFIANKDN